MEDRHVILHDLKVRYLLYIFLLTSEPQKVIFVRNKLPRRLIPEF
jgi:hypothetical protein